MSRGSIYASRQSLSMSSAEPAVVGRCRCDGLTSFSGVNGSGNPTREDDEADISMRCSATTP